MELVTKVLEETERRVGDKGNIENRSRTEEEIGEIVRDVMVGWEEEWEERWEGERQALVLGEIEHSYGHSLRRVIEEWVEESERVEATEGSGREERNQGGQGGAASELEESEREVTESIAIVTESIVRMIEMAQNLL